MISLQRHWACCSGTNITLRSPLLISLILLPFRMSGQWKIKSCLNKPLVFMGRAFTGFSKWYGNFGLIVIHTCMISYAFKHFLVIKQKNSFPVLILIFKNILKSVYLHTVLFSTTTLIHNGYVLFYCNKLIFIMTNIYVIVLLNKFVVWADGIILSIFFLNVYFF